MTVLTCALGPDSAGNVLTRLLREAESSIDAAIYEVGPSYRWALVAAARRGVHVRLLLDNHASDGNALTAVRLRAAGGECRVPAHGAQAHAKLLVIDGARVAVGTGNLIWRDAPRHAHGLLPPAAPPLAGTREWWAVVAGAADLAGAAGARFLAEWERAGPPASRWAAAAAVSPPPVGVPRPQVPPRQVDVAASHLRVVTGGAAIAELLACLIAGARRRVLAVVPYASTESAAARDLVERLSRARARGLDARLLLGERPAPGRSEGLAALGAEVRFMNPAASTVGHAKGVVVDGRVAVSSANWSGLGLGASFEAALLADAAEAAAYYADAWRRDWATALEI